MGTDVEAKEKSSERLNQQSGSLYGSDIGPLHIRYGCVAMCSCRAPNSGNGLVSDSFA